ncbi:isochorismatase family protein [Belnapia sp. T18]|uniref:Isochorismatase family protein n=1 Tax=Belnapia arida TaxID=2804533 RepID=A0ABS1TXA4_9PROT|nr:isochorismatase family protein [Belnapia arida]MBL6077086.1 isochorismatase family protein [Belnapia arida]
MERMAEPRRGLPRTDAWSGRMTGQGVFRYEETAMVVIDYQQEMFDQIRSETSAGLVDLNIRFLIRTAKAFGMPIVLSTVGVELGVNGPTRSSILEELPGAPEIDRSSMNAWEDAAFRDAVRATGRKRLLVGALFTEICLAFPVVEMLRDGYDVAFPVDAVGGLSQVAHATAIQRLVQAGAVPTTALAFGTELFRDWKSPVAGRARELVKGYLTEVAQATSPHVEGA